MADDHARIAPTAHVTAWIWRRIGMPHAEVFATRRGWRLFWAFELLGAWWTRLLDRSPSLTQVLEYRHKLIEGAALGHRPDLLVEIAGGLSRRGVTFAVDHGIRTVEIDLPHMVAAKTAVLGESPLADRLDLHTVTALDALSDGFAEALREVVGDAQRPVVVMEGLITYFRMDQRERLLTSVARGLAGKDAIVLADLYTLETRPETGLGAGALKFAISLVTRGQGTQGSWATNDEAEAFWKAAGFSAFDAVLPEELDAAARPRLERGPMLIARASV